MAQPHDHLTTADSFDPELGVYIPAGTPTEATVKFVNQEGGDLDVAGEQPTVTSIIARKAALELAKIQKQLAEEDADKKGELWTMQAALKRRGTSANVFVLCKLGSHCNPVHDNAFASQHRDSILTLDAMHVIGTRAEVMATVGQMWKCDEYTVRFVA